MSEELPDYESLADRADELTLDVKAVVEDRLDGPDEEVQHVKRAFECIAAGKVHLDKAEAAAELEPAEPDDDTPELEDGKVWAKASWDKYHESYNCAGEDPDQIDADSAATLFEPCGNCVGGN